MHTQNSQAQEKLYETEQSVHEAWDTEARKMHIHLVSMMISSCCVHRNSKQKGDFKMHAHVQEHTHDMHTAMPCTSEPQDFLLLRCKSLSFLTKEWELKAAAGDKGKAQHLTIPESGMLMTKANCQ